MLQPYKQYIAQHLHSDVRQLALKLKSKPAGMDVSLILRQIAGRQAVRYKLPAWYANEDILFPEHLPLEQCSSEPAACYKAALCRGESLADLTGGFGVDAAALSAHFKKVFFVERQEELCRLARHNFSVLGLNHVEVVQAEAEEFLCTMPSVDLIYIDPARRDEQGRKTSMLSDCSPDVSLLKDRLLQKAGTLLVKLSPMLDISQALQSLPETKEAHVVSVDNECKELLFLLNTMGVSEDVRMYAVNLSGKQPVQPFIFLRKEERAAATRLASRVGEYLYEPNASLLKAGAYKILTHRFPVEKLHPDSHLYTSEEIVPDFPGRIFQVDEAFSPGKKEIKNALNGVGQANITVRNFPLTVEEIRKKTGLKPGGDVYLFATTLSDGSRAMVKCQKPAGLK